MRDKLNQHTLPSAPLIERLGPMKLYPPSDRRVLQRAKTRGVISVSKADELCCRLLLMHPSMLWMEEFS